MIRNFLLGRFRVFGVFVLGVLVFGLSGCGVSVESVDVGDEVSDEISDEVGDGLVEERDLVVSMIVRGLEEEKSYKGTVSEGVSVIDLMEVIQNQGGMKFVKKDSSVGAFVEEINGVPNSVDDMMFWMLYVDDVSSNVGASDYKVKEGDLIEWRFEDVSGFGE